MHWVMVEEHAVTAVWCGVVLDLLAVKAATYGACNARGSAPPKAGES